MILNRIEKEGFALFFYCCILVVYKKFPISYGKTRENVL